jgi:lipoate-protein ligase A
MQWSLVIEPAGRTGVENMRIDAALLRAAQGGNAFLRFYRWDPPCLSFGRNEPALARYDVQRIADLGLDTVRRPTGGRAVWHEHEVTYAVTGPVGLFGSLRETYLAIHQVIAAGLRSLGADAELASKTGPAESPGAGSCFASPAGGEVMVRGRKLVGSAQVREGESFLQHGSILLRDHQEVVAQVTRGAARAPEATSLQEVLGRPVTFAETAKAIETAAHASWTGNWTNMEPDTTPGGGHQFSDPAWTWRR